MLIKNQQIVLAQQNVRLTTDISSWTYNSTAGSPTVTVLTASPPAVGTLVSLKPTVANFTEQICEVLTVSAGVSFTVEVLGTVASATGGAFASTGEQLMFKYKLPKCTLGKNDSIIVRAGHWCGTSASQQKIHFKLGGTDFALVGFTSAAAIAGRWEQSFSNRNSYASQIGNILDATNGNSYLGISSVALTTLTKNTLTDLDITITCEKPSTTGNFGLDYVQVLLVPSVQGLTYL